MDAVPKVKEGLCCRSLLKIAPLIKPNDFGSVMCLCSTDEII